jgi:hypothetical protein
LLIPPVLGSFLVLRFADLIQLKCSPFGRYIARTMTRVTEGVRLFGMLVMAAGAWLHSAALITLGLAIIFLAWGHGMFWPKREHR